MFATWDTVPAHPRPEGPISDRTRAILERHELPQEDEFGPPIRFEADGCRFMGWEYESPEHAGVMASIWDNKDFLMLWLLGKITPEMIEKMVAKVREFQQKKV